MTSSRAGSLAAATVLLATAALVGAQPVATGPEFPISRGVRSEERFPALGSATGSFVVAWTGHPVQPSIELADDTLPSSVFMRRYDAAGTPQGDESVVSEVSGTLAPPAVATGPSGFVIVWVRYDADPGVFGRRFDATGTPLGAEFKIADSHVSPAVVASDATGGFVVAWNDSSGAIMARLYDGAGSPLGAAFAVSTTPLADDSAPPAVARDASGRFVVAWIKPGDPNFLGDLLARQFDAAGAPLGDEFQVSTASGAQLSPAVATNATGGFVVVWAGVTAVFGRRFNVAGLPFAGDFQVSPNMGPPFWAFGTTPAVAFLGSGEFVVTWVSLLGEFDPSGAGVVGRRYTSGGTPIGGSFPVNATHPSHQNAPAVASLGGARDFVAAWISLQDHVIPGRPHVFGQRFTEACGDGLIDPGEQCDDGNHADGDGCRHDCQREECSACTGEPSTCTPITACAGGDGCCAAGCTSATDGDCVTLIGGKRLLIKNRARSVDLRRFSTLKFVSDDPALDVTPGTGIDPLADGAFLHVYSASSSSDSACYRLETASSPFGTAGARWQGTPPVLRYDDRRAVNGFCFVARIVDGERLSVTCRTGSAYTLNEPMQGSVAVRFKSGGTEYCTVFGGTVHQDTPAPPDPGPPAGVFSARNAPAPLVCPPEPSPCP